MADVSVKMGVSGLSQFKQGMTQAQASVKNVEAALKLNEKQLRANGDAEAYMQQKAQLLGQKLQAQKSQIANAEKALKAMKDSGVDPLSASYQRMETQLLTAQAAMLDTENEMRDMGTAGANAAKQTDQLTESLQSISKKMSLDQVIGGIDRITDGMEAAAKKAVELGKSIWDNIVDSAGYADDIATLASRLGLSTTEVQQMQYVSGEFEASAEDIGKAWRKVKLSMASNSKDITAIYQELGIATRTGMTEMGGYVQRNRDYKDVFWEIGEALMAMPIEKSAEREEYATKLLGKSWDELIPLFTAGREAYEEAMEAAPAASEKAVEQAASLNDRLGKLEQSWASLKVEVIGGIAPALEKAAVALENIINSVTEYLQTEEGQEQLQKMSDALSGIIENLTDFDPEGVVAGVEKVLNGITGAFQWIADNWETVKTGILMIAGAFGVMKLTSLGLTVANLVSGLKTRFGGTPVGTPTTTGTPTTAPTAAPAAEPLLHGGGSSAEAIAAAEATHLLGGSGGMGGALGGVGTLSLGGALGGLAIIAGGTVLAGKLVSDINDAENKAREVSTDVNRLNGLGGGTLNNIPQNLSNAMNGAMKDKRLVVQETVRALLGSSGGSAGVYDELKWLGYNLGGDTLGAFNYVNTSGESRNKLIDMLHMSGSTTAAAAALVLRSAGYGYNELGADSQAYQEALQYLNDNWMEMKRNGGFTEGLTELEKFFMASGTFNENGEWTIPGLEEDLAAQQAATEAMNTAAETMQGLPDAIVAGIQGAKINVTLSLFPHANGLPYVPFDGYMAMLHKGEQVIPARAAAGSRSYSSNLYVESMVMNNGMDAEGLAEAMAAAQRRTSNGYGS